MTKIIRSGLGQRCAEFRRSLGISQRVVADELGYSILNISAFENGRNNNMEILMWYIEKGFNVVVDNTGE